MGIESRILTLRGLAPGPGVAARARIARYAALTAGVCEAGLSDLLLGHHGGDQAETFVLREAAGSGPAGLACMASIVETTGLRLVRPLLGVAGGALRDMLRAQGIGWIEDPSNHNMAAARTRVRRHLAETADAGRAVISRAHDAGLARRSADAALAAGLAACVSIFPLGYAVVAPGPVGVSLLAALIRGLTGAAYPERGAALARLAAGPLQGTLGGVRFLPAGRLGPGTLVVREESAMAGPVAARPGCVWDRRFRLHSDMALPAGAEMSAVGDDAAMFRRRSGLASAVLRTLPAVRVAGDLVCVPHLGYFSGWTNPSLRLSFCPPNPVSGAPFAVFDMGDAQTARAHHVLLDTDAMRPDETGRRSGKD
jgi:tRNA(Ile)-lysidine synthase